jgi:hypothetical protein
LSLFFLGLAAFFFRAVFFTGFLVSFFFDGAFLAAAFFGLAAFFLDEAFFFVFLADLDTAIPSRTTQQQF